MPQQISTFERELIALPRPNIALAVGLQQQYIGKICEFIQNGQQAELVNDITIAVSFVFAASKAGQPEWARPITRQDHRRARAFLAGQALEQTPEEIARDAGIRRILLDNGLKNRTWQEVSAEMDPLFRAAMQFVPAAPLVPAVPPNQANGCCVIL
jgi:hypothetical protein